MCYNQDLNIYAQRLSNNHGIKSMQYTRLSQTAIAFPLWANTLSEATFSRLQYAWDMETINATVKFIPYDAWSYAYLLENTMAANHSLLEEDEVILSWYTCQVNVSTAS